ncbi:MAG: hypothetical protein JWO36_1401 [Myxococcales bacterium]|nr:hypothetical protein [Myxococcales bacterium]
MKKIVLVLILLATTGGAAHADVGFGLFVGRPTGLDIKLGLSNRAGLDIVAGWDTYRDGYRDDYAHVTYLLTPVVSYGRSVIVPLRLGIGVAVFDGYYYHQNRFGEGLNVAVRAPVEIGLRFRSVPLEIYGEIALRISFLRDSAYYDLVQLDGGIGFRIYF